MIYFDNAATASPPIFTPEQYFGNPSSPHNFGIRAERALSKARNSFANILNCQENEIIFTSGGTESNNLALIGFVMANKRKDIAIYAEPWEHPSILEPIKFIKEQEFAHSYIVPLAPFTALPLPSHEIQLFSISHVCHETGDINDIESFAKSIKLKNPAAVIHVDGVQGFCKEIINLSNVDMYSFSSHKTHGPGGIGGLAIRGKTRILPLTHGGGQERGLRPGTENIAGLTSFSNIAEHLHNLIDDNHRHIAEINAIIKSIADELPDVFINNRGGDVSPYILNMSFLGMNGETLVHLLSEKGVYASMGAACRSRKRVKSALELMGFEPTLAKSAVRFSFSHLNTLEEAREAKAIIIDAVQQLRRMIRA